jgi:hypothetical protein
MFENTPSSPNVKSMHKEFGLLFWKDYDEKKFFKHNEKCP